MEKVVWADKDGNLEACMESSHGDYRVLAISAICELATEALNVSWNEHRIVSQLLKSAIGSEVGKILYQYLHSQLEIIGRGLNRDFGIDEQIEPGYATHAKLSNFSEAIKAKFSIS